MEPRPVYAYGLFFMHENGLVDQEVIFEYYDPDKYYAGLLRRPVALSKELKMLGENMQYFLDQEEVYINDERVYPRVVDVNIGVKERGRYAYIVFNIEFTGKLRKGINRYVNIYEEERAEYEYIVYWFLPVNARVVKAEVGVPYEILPNGRGLWFRVKPGTLVGGREEIVFDIKE
ncbi:MAG: hypothetical protein GXO43_09760 [Crenarchaeota archaeon]|nr:hypothetical protein [Thermoproteota archaeon]